MENRLFLKSFNIILLTASVVLPAWAQSPYTVAGIREDMLKDTHAVIRKKELHYEINTNKKWVLTGHEIITILKPEARDFAIKPLYYDKDKRIKYFKASSYDAFGKEITKLKKSEFIDRSSISGFSLYEDSRVMAADLQRKTYPLTVEFEYQIIYDYLFFIPSISVIPDEHVAVENATYTITAPSDLMPRYEPHHCEAPQVSKEGDLVVNRWVFSDLPPVTYESYAPPNYYEGPVILLAPNVISYAGYEGTFESWKAFGQWIARLNTGRDNISVEKQQQLRKLTEGMDTKEKIKAIYEHLQNTTRYVSIQIGIGGYQPFGADLVEQTGYGDCKALSNYTKTMLAAVGVSSNYVLIGAGRNPSPLREEFPYNQFNHAVLAVPLEEDTIWLECTSQTNPFGYAGTFTGDRTALMITENGGEIVHTPAYKTEDNLQYRTATVSLDANGHAEAYITTTYTGIQSENDGLNFVQNTTRKEQEKWIYEHTDIPSFDLVDFVMKEDKESLPITTLNLNLHLSQYASVSNKRLFLKPNLMNQFTHVPAETKERKAPVYKGDCWIDVDTIRYEVPENFNPEFIPEDVSEVSPFGKYTATIRFEQSEIVYVRRMEVYKGTYPAESYADLVDFYKKVYRADKVRVVLVNTT